MQKTCQLCKHFIQHYRKEKENDYCDVNCGHCKFPRLKHRNPGAVACYHFVEKLAETE